MGRTIGSAAPGMRGEVLPLATERSEATLGAYRGAKASITDVLLARRSEIEVRMQALQLEMDTARLWRN